MRKVCLVFLFAAVAAWAQLSSNTITVTAVRTSPVANDSATFTVSVSAPMSSTFDEVLAFLQPVGITASNLSGIYQTSYGAASDSYMWSFTSQLPLARLSDTVKALSAIQGNGAMAISFGASAASSNAVGQDYSQCPVTGLLSDATAQAQQLASLAGVTLGPVQALSDAGSSGVAGVSIAASRVGYAFFNVTQFLLGAVPYSTTNDCALTVQFGVLRY